MASMLAGLGTLFLLFSLVILSHALQLGIAIIVLAALVGVLMLLRRPAVRDESGTTPLDLQLDLPASERLAVELAEEPSERVPAQRSTLLDETQHETPEHEATQHETTQREHELAGV